MGHLQSWGAPKNGVTQDTVSSELAVLTQQGNQIGESLSGDCVGTELEFELGQSAAILALSSSSRALSLLICKISLSTCKISLSSCCIRCSRSIDLISISTTGCQLSYSYGEDCVYDNQRRQRGNEDKSSDLLINPDRGASKEIDMVITRKQGDQAKQKPANDRDPTLEIKPKEHRSKKERLPLIVHQYWREDLLVSGAAGLGPNGALPDSRYGVW